MEEVTFEEEWLRPYHRLVVEGGITPQIIANAWKKIYNQVLQEFNSYVGDSNHVAWVVGQFSHGAGHPSDISEETQYGIDATRVGPRPDYPGGEGLSFPLLVGHCSFFLKWTKDLETAQQREWRKEKEKQDKKDKRNKRRRDLYQQKKKK